MIAYKKILDLKNFTPAERRLYDVWHSIRQRCKNPNAQFYADYGGRGISICKEWEKTTNLVLEYAYYSKMVITDVNNYIAVYTNGKYKCKGSFEFENLPLHKNKSALIVRIALFNYFTEDIPIEDTIRNHKNIFDFCIGRRTKSDSRFFYLDKNANKYDLSKTIRYFISNKGVVIKKRMVDLKENMN